jgi:hypothetical protein
MERIEKSQEILFGLIVFALPSPGGTSLSDIRFSKFLLNGRKVKLLLDLASLLLYSFYLLL